MKMTRWLPRREHPRNQIAAFEVLQTEVVRTRFTPVCRWKRQSIRSNWEIRSGHCWISPGIASVTRSIRSLTNSCIKKLWQTTIIRILKPHPGRWWIHPTKCSNVWTTWSIRILPKLRLIWNRTTSMHPHKSPVSSKLPPIWKKNTSLIHWHRGFGMRYRSCRWYLVIHALSKLDTRLRHSMSPPCIGILVSASSTRLIRTKRRNAFPTLHPTG